MKPELTAAERERHENNAKAILAWLDGKPLQYRHHEEVDWRICHAPIFDCEHNEYRPAPEPKVRPWTAEQAIGKTVKSKANKQYYMIIETREDGGALLCSATGWYSFHDLLNHFTQLDGSPCGVIE